ncbi:diacylglycerol kinase family protein [Halieaceae bacterium IMCC14734]|uniref:Diacylglycerol kinase family protein n=1 Tax=Candidatus Litorirhabdus singularis TaxID=2518993 RepID=A0ABT3TAD3_9GAMM|nr:diacylglycerol kinase family protein [Candidatus Litorirhabdus singularis]
MLARVRSFGYAFQGLATLVREQHNARIHVAATLVVAAAGWNFEVSRLEWVILLLTVALVWLSEAMNSALEYLADATVPEQHPLVGKAKDVAAAGVLICAGVAVLVAALVFIPYF